MRMRGLAAELADEAVDLLPDRVRGGIVNDLSVCGAQDDLGGVEREVERGPRSVAAGQLVGDGLDVGLIRGR